MEDIFRYIAHFSLQNFRQSIRLQQSIRSFVNRIQKSLMWFLIDETLYNNGEARNPIIVII